MPPDLRQLHALVAIARHGTLGRAADALACSPSALSMQLTALQQRLGLTLLRRTGRGLTLTADGEQLLPAAREAVRAAEHVSLLAAQASGRAPRTGLTTRPPVPVTLGTILDPAAIRLGEFLRAVHERGPHLHPELRHGISGTVLRDVHEGRLDGAFCLGQPDAHRLRCLRLTPVRYVVVAPRGWQARLSGRSWAELAALPWITTPRESVHHQLLRPVWQRERVTPNTVACVDQEASMIDLVRAGFGLSLAREAVALREADQAGLALSRSHGLDTALWLVSPLAPRDDSHEGLAARELLFSVAADVWPPA